VIHGTPSTVELRKSHRNIGRPQSWRRTCIQQYASQAVQLSSRRAPGWYSDVPMARRRSGAAFNSAPACVDTGYGRFAIGQRNRRLIQLQPNITEAHDPGAEVVF
jgi:hypothetical protein